MSVSISLYILLYAGETGAYGVRAGAVGNGDGNRAVCTGGGRATNPMVAGVEGVVNENAKKSGCNGLDLDFRISKFRVPEWGALARAGGNPNTTYN
tara:strand:- start:72 stop:359 length:288 start_codon:yes stop_codon:yes gene_type:complete